jgi:cysteine synthase A
MLQCSTGRARLAAGYVRRARGWRRPGVGILAAHGPAAREPSAERGAARAPSALSIPVRHGGPTAETAMDIRDGFIDSVGNTPLIRLRKASEQTGCSILGKAEFLNPGGSVKDRAAKYMVLDAERRGVLQAGGVIVEGTAGNTGIGLAYVANARGYRTIIVMPETQSQEKKDALRLAGAEVREVPAVPYKNPEHYVHQAARLAEELAAAGTPGGVLYANQWDNVANRDGHIASTGPEIWHQTDGTVDGFTCAIGTGGTLAGIATYLKQMNPAVVTAVADPPGAAMYSYVKHGTLESEGSSITEGIGQGRVTGNIDGAPIDDAFRIPDEESVAVVFDLLEHEGLFLGGSSGVNVAGAIRLARALGPGKTVVTVLCDSGARYQSKLFNPAFLRSKGLPVPGWIEG